MLHEMLHQSYMIVLAEGYVIHIRFGAKLAEI